jgi:hypothetical protein
VIVEVQNVLLSCMHGEYAMMYNMYSPLCPSIEGFGGTSSTACGICTASLVEGAACGVEVRAASKC